MGAHSSRPGGRRATTISARVSSGTAVLARDPNRANAWLLEVDGTRQSHVDLDEPTILGFDYMRRVSHLIDERWPHDDPIDAVHLGGGALALPRFIAASRPGSRQRVFELDAKLTAFVRAELPLDSRWRIRVRDIDARDGLELLRDTSADVVINDVYDQARVPARLGSIDLVQHAARVLRPGGMYVANIIDRPPLAFTRVQVANVAAVFTHHLLMAPGPVLQGRHRGNVVLAASMDQLPVGRLTHLCASDPNPSRVMSGTALTRFRGGALPVGDADAESSPAAGF